MLSSPSPSLSQKTASSHAETLPQLLRKTGLWRASHLDYEFRPGIPTGYSALDRELPGGGWPTAGLTELLYEQAGIGELRLLAPALAQLSQQPGRWLLWVSPPYLPYPPALAQAGIDPGAVLIVRPPTISEGLWAMEQALASQSCSAVLGWPEGIQAKQIRRLQLASKAGQCLGLLFRRQHAAGHASPAELRIQLSGQAPVPLKASSAITLQILKRRGGWASNAFTLALHDELHQITPDFTEMIVNNPHSPRPALGFIDPGRSSPAYERQRQ